MSLRDLALAALADDEKATPGPWEPTFDEYGEEVWLGGTGCGMWRIGPAFLGGDGRKTDGTKNPEGLTQMESDAAFIASARTREPQLARALLATLGCIDAIRRCESAGQFHGAAVVAILRALDDALRACEDEGGKEKHGD